MMRKATKLSDFDRLQNSVCKERLFPKMQDGCSRDILVNTYAKWMNFGETISIYHGVGHTSIIKKDVGDSPTG